MIGLLFQLASEFIEVRIDKNNVYFRNNMTSGAFATLDNLKLSYAGVCKEFPDLKDTDNWKQEAIKRFKEKLNTYKTDDEKANYIMEDLKKFGYKPLYKNKQGHRPEKIKND